MAGVWLTSDLHFGHSRIAELRGFGAAAEHDATLVQNWRRLIAPEDTVWVLGDISGGGAKAQEAALGVLADLPGRKLLVAGNHDSVHPMHGLRTNLRWQPLYSRVFDWVGSIATIKVEGVKLQLSHFPFEADHTPEPRFARWRPVNQGQHLAHGHTHSTSPIAFVENELHVGVDAHRLRPVPIGQIAAHLKLNRQLMAALDRQESVD